MIDGLCEVLDEHLENHRWPAVIGCVPWLDSAAVVDRLLKMDACCVVVNKGWLFREATRLHRYGKPVCNKHISGLEMMVPDGDGPTLIGPFSRMPEHELGPLRVAGWPDKKDTKLPILHAKLAVLGYLHEVCCPDVDPDIWSEWHFAAEAVWSGSVNWTERSRSHLEFGFLCDDPSLVWAAERFVADVIAFSEPVGTPCVGPEPNLVCAEFDDEAMAAACERMSLDNLEEE